MRPPPLNGLDKHRMLHERTSSEELAGVRDSTLKWDDEYRETTICLGNHNRTSSNRARATNSAVISRKPLVRRNPESAGKRKENSNIDSPSKENSSPP